MTPFPLLNKSWMNPLHCNHTKPGRESANICHIANTSSFSITAIPEDDVLPIVFSYLSFNDLVSLEKTCRLFNRVIRKYHLKESAFYFNLFKNTDPHREAGFDYWADREYQRLKVFFTANNHQVLAIPARKELKQPFLHFHMLRELIYCRAYEFKLVTQLPNKAIWTRKLSPCGRFLLTQNSEDHLEMWRYDATCNPQMVARVPHNCGALPPIFSRTGRDLMTLNSDNVFIWSIDNNQNWRQTVQINYNSSFIGSMFSPSGCLYLFYSSYRYVRAPGERDEGTNIRVWGRDQQGCWTEQAVIEHDNKIMGVKIAPTEQHILSYGRDNIIKIHSRNDAGNWFPNGVIYHQAKVNNPCFSVCGRHILTNSEDLTARIWSCNDHGQWAEQQILPHSERIRHAIFSDSGRSVATCAGSTLNLWTYYTGLWQQQTTPHCNEIITSIQFSPSEHLVVGTRQGRIMLLDGQGGVQHLVKRGAEVCRTIFSASGNRAVTTLNNQTAIIWSLNSHGGKVEGCMCHFGEIRFVHFLQQDRQILSWTGYDGKVKVWRHCVDGTWKNSTVIDLGNTGYFRGPNNKASNFSSREHLLYTGNDEIWGHDEKGYWRRKGKIPILRRTRGDSFLPFPRVTNGAACFLPCQSHLLLHNPIEKTEEIWEILPSGCNPNTDLRVGRGGKRKRAK